MVKFSFFALAGALAAADAASAPGKIVKVGDRNLRRGDPATEALMKKAVPYKKSGAKKVGRRAEEEAEEFEIDGTYSLQFSECRDVRTVDEDLFDEDIVGYVESGKLVAAKSYVVFHVCQENVDCYLDSSDNLYMVDLGTYLSSVAKYHANKRNDFCEACKEFEETCNPEEEEEEEAEEEADAEGEEEEGEGEEGEGEGEEEGERKLKKAKRTKAKRRTTPRRLENKEAINCNKCAAYECYEDDENMDDGQQRREELDNQVSEWIEGLAECQETGQMMGDLNLYLGFMCSPYGDGVEPAVFANEECTWYTKKSFYDYYDPSAYADDNGNSINYLTYAEDFIKSAFHDTTPCEQKQYYDPYADEEEDADEEEENQYEASEYCREVMEEEVVSFSQCAADEDKEEEDDDALANYDWFTYDVKDAEDINDVCVAINQLDAADITHVYDEESSGTWYKRNKKGKILYGDEPEGMGSGAVIGIVILVVGAIGAAGFFFMKKQSAKPVDSEYQGGEMS